MFDGLTGRLARSPAERASAGPVAEARALAGSVEPPDADALLQLSRRVDWRFLLPNPSLGRCAFFGETEELLLWALRVFCDSLDVTVSPDLPTGPRAGYDVVVMRRPTRELLRGAAAYVRPGGYLYIEDGRPRPQSGRTVRRVPVRAYRRELDQLGFDEVSTYWPWPDAARCTRILSLDAPEATSRLLSWQTRGARAWAKTALVHGLASVGLLPYVVPSVSLVAGRSGGPRRSSG